jgi:ankyrin repeat protein
MKQSILSTLVAILAAAGLASCGPTRSQAFKAVREGSIPVLKSWIGSSAKKASAVDPDRNSLLAAAIQADRADMVALLLDAGADPETRLPRGFTALLLALAEKKEECALVLIEKGADIKAVNGSDVGKTALHYCAIGGLLRSARVLVEKGHDVNALDSVEANPLGWAAWKGSLEMVQYLAGAGGDFRNVDSYGDDALEASEDNPDPAVREYLLKLADRHP